MLRRVIVSSILAIILIAIGVAVAARLIATKPKPPTGGEPTPLLTVRATEIQPETVIQPITAYGTARAQRAISINAQVAGEITHVSPRFEAGAPVEQGDLLVRIDDREYQANLQRTRAQLAAAQAALERVDVEQQNIDNLIAIARRELELAEREYNRVRDLLEAGTSTPREADQFRLAYEQATRTLRGLENQRAILPKTRAERRATLDLRRAEVAVAELSLERTQILAPFTGKLDEVHVELGTRVQPGARICDLIDPSRVEIQLQLPVSQRSLLQTGADCQLQLENSPLTTWNGSIARIAPRADEQTRSFAAYVDVNNAEQNSPLLPGTFVRAIVNGPTLRDVVVVPRGAIQQDHVFVWNEGRARKRPISLDRRIRERAVVRGLQPGDVLITSNFDTLYDGAPVDIRLTDVAADVAADSPEPRPTPQQPSTP